MGALGVLGALAGGYANAAEQERRRQFESDQRQRDAQLALSQMIIQNPAVPPEYKGTFIQHAVDVVNTPHGKKLPSFDKAMQQAIQMPIGTPAKTQSVPQPPTQLAPPAPPPAMAGAAPAGGVAGLPAGITPVGVPPMVLPGGEAVVHQAQSPYYSPGGTFHVMSQQEIQERETQAQLARAHEISQATGVPLERVLGMQPKYATVPWGGGVYNTQTGDITSEATPKPIGAPEKLPDAQGMWHLYQRYQDGKLHMIPTPEGVVVPPPPNWAETVRTGQYHYVDADGNVHEVGTKSTSEKVIPGVKGQVAPSVTPGAGGQGGAGGGGRIISGNAPKLSPNLVRTDTSYRNVSTQLDRIQTPIDQLAGRMGRLQDTLNQNTPQADALVAPELLTVMAGGQGSGLRMNEAEIARIVGGRSKWEGLKAAINKWKLDPQAALSITPDQRQQIHALVAAVSSKIEQKRQILADAQQALIDAKSPEEHRKILADTRSKVLAVDTGATVTPPNKPPSTSAPAPSSKKFDWSQHPEVKP